MEVEPVNININSDDELENDVEVSAANVNHSTEQNVNNSSAEVVCVVSTQNGPYSQTVNQPYLQHSQEYLSSQDSVVSQCVQSPQLGYGWYPYVGPQSGSLTQESETSLAGSAPLTQDSENPYSYCYSEQDDAITVCESLTQDSICSFSTMCSEATTMQDFSQDYSQPELDLQNFTEADIGAHQYFDQAFYNDVTPSASEHNINLVESSQTTFQNQQIVNEVSHYAPQQSTEMQTLQLTLDGNNTTLTHGAVSYNENLNPYSCASQVPMMPDVSDTSQVSSNQTSYYPTNAITSFDANGTSQVQQNDTQIPVINQAAFEAAVEPPTPALHLSEAGILSVLLRDNIAVEMTLDRALRLVDHKQNMVAAATSQGEMSCLYHAAGKICNQGGVCEADLFWNRRAKLCPEGIIFSCGPACYMLQPRHLAAIPPDFADLSTDLSVTMLFSYSRCGPHIIPHLEEVIRQATYKYHEDGVGVTISINGVRVEQRGSGDVFVEHDTKYLHMSSKKQFLHVDTPMSEMSVEKDWLVKVKYRGLSLICGTKGMTLSDGISDCGFNPYRRSFLQPAFFNVQTIILNGESIKQDYKGRWLRRRKNNHFLGRRPFYRHPEPDYSGRVQGLDQIIRRVGEPDEEYYARVRTYRAKTDRDDREYYCKAEGNSGETCEDTKVQIVRNNKELCEALKASEVATHDIGAAGDNIAHV